MGNVLDWPQVPVIVEVPAARALFRTTAGTSIIASVSHLQPGGTPITPAAVDGQARSLRRAPDRCISDRPSLRPHRPAI